MGMRAAVAGASGYAGGELLRLLIDHPQLEVGAICAGASAGGPVTGVHPHLPRLADRIFEATEPEHLAGADVVFLALPHGASAELAARLPAGQPVVDLGADFRLAAAAAWERFYGTPHAGRWPYGLPELPGARDQIRSSTRVANPGCNATAVILGLAPLLATGLITPQDIVSCFAAGTSGAGRNLQPHLLASQVMGSVSVYQAGGTHRHTPEIEQILGEACGQAVTVNLTPMLVPMPRGILATSTALVTAGATENALREALRAAYDGEPFVQVLPPGAWPVTAATTGSNAAQVQVALDARTGRAVVVCAIDNLGKGAAGAAIQNANLMLGLGETTGLTAQGVAP